MEKRDLQDLQKPEVYAKTCNPVCHEQLYLNYPSQGCLTGARLEQVQATPFSALEINSGALEWRRGSSVVSRTADGATAVEPTGGPERSFKSLEQSNSQRCSRAVTYPDRVSGVILGDTLLMVTSKTGYSCLGIPSAVFTKLRCGYAI